MRIQKLTSPDALINRIQDNIKLVVDPVATLETNSGLILPSVSLVSGANSINHTLGRNLLGWYVVRQRNVASSFYDTQDSNTSPSITLNLHSSAAVVVDLFVF